MTFRQTGGIKIVPPEVGLPGTVFEKNSLTIRVEFSADRDNLSLKVRDTLDHVAKARVRKLLPLGQS